MPAKKKKIIEATLFTLIGYGTSQVIRLAANLVLARLLVPEFFGIMSIVMVFQYGLLFLSDIGLSPSIIRSKRGEDPVFLDTAWSIKIIRGLIVAVIIAFIAYPVSRIYETPQLMKILPVIALSSILQGFTSTSMAVLTKRLNQKVLVTAKLIFQVISSAVAIIIAYYTRSIWALVISDLVAALVKMIWSHWIYEGKHRFTFEKEAVRELLSFGKWILFSTAIYYLASQVDRLLLGKLFGMKLFGIYNIALVFSELPKSVLDHISNKVIFPVLSEYKKEEIREKIRRPRKFLLKLTAAALALACCCADYLIVFLYDDRYLPAAWMLPMLFLGIWPRLLVLSIDRSLLAIGKPKYLAFGNLTKLVYMVAVLPLFFHLWGAVGAIVAVTLNDIPLYIAINIGLKREKMSLMKQDVLITSLLIGGVALLILIRILFGLGIPGLAVYQSLHG